jgi:hypothetical protein
MSWTYSHNPSNSAKDEVRFLIGDTSENDPLLHDEEIIYLLNQYNQYPLNASIEACERVIAKFSRLSDESVGSVSKSFSQKADGYSKLRDMLRNRMAINGSRPYAGGISVLDKQANTDNISLEDPTFTKHQFENKQLAPWTSQSEIETSKRGGL